MYDLIGFIMGVPRLRVFYGWTRINKTRKKEALSVIFENGRQNEERTQLFIKRMQDTVYIRMQTEDEAKDGARSNRMFTEFNIPIACKPFYGDIEALLRDNYLADENNVSKSERERIRKALRKAYRTYHPNARIIQQLSLFE